MDKYVTLTRKSLKSLAGRVSTKLRIANGEVSVVEAPKSKRPATDMEGLFRDIVAMKTVTGDFEETHAALEYIDEYLSQRAMHVNRFEWDNYESLVATSKHTKRPKVMIAIHLDVVPAEDDMFELREKDGKYYGRGTFDMKFAIPPALQLVDDLEDKLHEYDFGIMITTDEETGGFKGVAKLTEEEGYLPDVVIVPDGGDNWDIETFCKGIWFVTLNAKGKDAHGSRPWEGESANQRLMDIIYEIKRQFPYTDRKSSTVNIGTLNGGDVVNKVAADASAMLDIRFASFEDDKKIRDTIAKLCKKRGVELVVDVYTPPLVNYLTNPLLQSFMRSVEKVTGHAPSETMSYAGTDARHFGAKGVPCAIVRPPGGGLHGPDEWVDKEGFLQLKDIYRDFIDREAKL